MDLSEYAKVLEAQKEDQTKIRKLVDSLNTDDENDE